MVHYLMSMLGRPDHLNSESWLSTNCAPAGPAPSGYPHASARWRPGYEPLALPQTLKPQLTHRARLQVLLQVGLLAQVRHGGQAEGDRPARQHVALPHAVLAKPRYALRRGSHLGSYTLS